MPVFWVVTPLDLQLDISISGEHRPTLSIFMPEDGESEIFFLKSGIFKTTRRYNAEDQRRHCHRRESLKSHNAKTAEDKCKT
jgi:hypothetical protein